MAGRGLGALAGLAVGLAATGALAGPARPDVAEGPSAVARTLGEYAGDSRSARDLPTLAGADPADAAAVDADKMRRLARGLMAEAVNGAPEEIDKAGEIAFPAPAEPGRDAGAPGPLATVVTVQRGPDPDARRQAAAEGAGATIGGESRVSDAAGPAIDPSRVATAALTGPGGLLAVVLGPPVAALALDTGAHRPVQPALGHLAGGAVEPSPVKAEAAEWLSRATAGVKRLRAYPAYVAAGSMVTAVLALLLILRRQPRRRKRRHH